MLVGKRRSIITKRPDFTALSFTSASSHYLQSAATVTALPLTLACWFQSTTTAVAGTLMAVGINSGSFQRATLIASDGATGVVRALSAGGGSVLVSTTTTYTANTWAHACAVFTTTTSRTVYLNGGGAQTNTDSDIFTGSFDYSMIGARIVTSPGSFINGLVAEAGIWSAALTAAEVAELAAGGKPSGIRPASLVAYWPLRENGITENTLVGSAAMDGTGHAPAKTNIQGEAVKWR